MLSLGTCRGGSYITASKNSSLQHHDASSEAALGDPGRLAICETISAGSGSEGTRADPVHSSRDVFYIAPLVSMHASLKDEGLAYLTRTLIDRIRRADEVFCSNDIEFIKQLINDIDSVIG